MQNIITLAPLPPILGGSELKVPQFWEATSVGGFPDLRKVARIWGANAGFLRLLRVLMGLASSVHFLSKESLILKEAMDVVDLKRDIELLSERLGKTQDYL